MAAPEDSDALFRLVFEGTASTVIFDRDLRVRRVAGRAVADGHDPRDYEGRLVTEIVPPDQARMLEPIYRAAIEGNHRIVPYRSPDGRPHRLHAHPVRRADGTIWGGLATSIEVGEADQVVHEEAARFRAVFDHAPHGIAIVDGEGRIAEANRRWSEIVGRTRSELEGEPIDEAFAPVDRTRLREAVGGLHPDAGDEVELELRVARPDGEVLLCAISLSLASQDGGSDGATAVVAQLQDITERKRSEERLQHLADHDPLTGLLNRRAFERRLSMRLRGARSGDRGGALLLADLDGLKEVNDQFGHLAGDDVIGSFAAAVRATVRESEPVGRIGGDEFAVLAEPSDPRDLERIGRRLLEEVVVRSRGLGLPLSTSIGVVSLADGVSERELWRRADRALYSAKHEGGNTLRIWSSDDDGVPPPSRRSAPEGPAGGSDQEVGAGDEQGNPKL